MLLIVILLMGLNIYLARKKCRSVIVWIIFCWYSQGLSTIVLLFLRRRAFDRPSLATWIVFWPFLFVFLFSNLYIVGILFNPIPAELFSGLLWGLLYSRFLLYLWNKSRDQFRSYLIKSSIPLILAIALGLVVCSVRASFKDGMHTITKLQEFKKMNGRYPPDIHALGYNSLADYRYNFEDDSFGFSYRTGLLDSAFYDSKTKKWRGDMPVGGVPYDIIGVEQLGN